MAPNEIGCHIFFTSILYPSTSPDSNYFPIFESMKFEYPGFLFAFLLLAIPIIIHLFNFRKYKVLYFSSLHFLRQVEEETRSTQKLKHLLVLIARILAFSALILAFAQPYMPVEKTGKEGGNPVLAIYIDNSFSMTLKGTEGELISEAREQARKLIEKASVETRIMLVTNEMSGIEQRLVTKVEALDRLDKIEVSPLVKTTSDVVNWMRDEISKEAATNQKLGVKQYVILSDFQKSSADFKKIKKDSTGFYYPIQLVPQSLSNVFIDSIWFNDPNFKVGVNNELNVRIKNTGDKDLTNVELQLDVNGTKRDVFVDILANQEMIAPINYSDLKPGLKKGVVKVNDKQVFFDDEYFFSYEVKEKSYILIVNGKSAVPNIAKVYNLDNYYEVQSVDETSFTPDALNNKDFVVLNGLDEISTGTAASLLSFAQEGGSLALFPGENINVSSWNGLLQKLKMPLLGALQSEGVKVKSINYNDVFFIGVFEKKPENLNLPLQNKIYKISNGSSSNAMNLVSLQNGLPLFVRSNSNYCVFLFGSSLAPAFGNFTSNALFTTILLRSAEMSQRRIPIALTIGGDSRFPVYNAPKKETPIHLKGKDIDFIPQTEKISQITYISIAGMEAGRLKSGLYQIVNETELGNLALNYDRKESNITALTSSEVKDGLTAQGIENISFSTIDQGQSATRIELEKPKEYWRILVLFALLFLLAEMALLKFLK